MTASSVSPNASSLSNGAAASGVLGQESFVVGPRTTAADRFSSPTALLVEPAAPSGYLITITTGRSPFSTQQARPMERTRTSSWDSPTSCPREAEPPIATSRSRLRDRPGCIGSPVDPERGNHRVLRFSPAGITPPPDTIKPLLTVKTRPAPSPSSRDISSPARHPTTSDQGSPLPRWKRPFLKAKGKTSWSFRALLPKRKRTTIRIHAEELSGNRSAVKTFRITRI